MPRNRRVFLNTLQGRITKRGDRYLRTLLIHGARAELRAAATARSKAEPLDRTCAWPLALAANVGLDVAVTALANKTARQLWAAEKHEDQSSLFGQ